MTVQDGDDAATPPAAQGSPRAIDRRSVLRGAGIVAGVAGAAAVGAVTASPAAAADGEPVILGNSHTSESATEIVIGGGAGDPEPTLSLGNADGPSLHLQPLIPDWQGELNIGDIANTDLGPIIGVESANGPTNTYLASGLDLEDLPTPFTVRPVRLIDTRHAADRASVLAAAPAAFDATGRLSAGAWIDVQVTSSVGDFLITAAHINVTIVDPSAGGWVAVFAGGDDYPGTSTVNFVAGQVVANAAFTPVGVVLGKFAIRVWASAPVYVIVDLSGGAVRGRSALPTTSEKAVRRTAARTALVTKVERSLSR